MLFVYFLDMMKNIKCLLGIGSADGHFLESAFQSAIFLDAFAVFIVGGGTYALQFATRQSRFEQIGSIHRTFCIPGAHNSVNFIDKNHNIFMGRCFLYDGFNAFFKLSAIFGACHHACHIERNNALIEKHMRHLALNDA